MELFEKVVKPLVGGVLLTEVSPGGRALRFDILVVHLLLPERGHNVTSHPLVMLPGLS